MIHLINVFDLQICLNAYLFKKYAHIKQSIVTFEHLSEKQHKILIKKKKTLSESDG